MLRCEFYSYYGLYNPLSYKKLVGVTMSTYVLVLIFLNGYGISMTSIDFNSRDLCERAGYQYLDKMPGTFTSAKYMCLERR